MSDVPTPDAAQGRGPDKLLAIGAYGETVAAYRYLVLSEKAPNPRDRHEFAEMADEEQVHKQRLQALLAEMYPQADFVLTPEDKELVVTGTRLLDVRDEASFHDALRMILQTERKTAAFYALHAKTIAPAHLRALFHELAEEGADHYHRLKAMARRCGMPHMPEED
jgi:rubrerythrin